MATGCRLKRVAPGAFQKLPGRALLGVALALMVLLMAACGSTRTVEKQGSRRPADPLLSQFAGNFQYGRDADGTMRVQTDQRSSFETDAGQNVQSRFNAREFNAQQWRGADRAARVRDYQGAEKQFRSTGAREQGAEHRLSGAASREQGAAAREQMRSFNTTTSAHQQQTAREAAVHARERTSVGPAAERSVNYRPAEDSRAQNHRPITIDRETGQRGYSPSQVRSLLGKGG